MIKITTINQLDSDEVSVIIDTNAEKEKFEKALLNADYEFNSRTGYWEKKMKWC